MSDLCRLRRGEGYAACDDEVVSKCALPEKKEARSAPVSRNTPRYLTKLAFVQLLCACLKTPVLPLSNSCFPFAANEPQS